MCWEPFKCSLRACLLQIDATHEVSFLPLHPTYIKCSGCAVLSAVSTPPCRQLSAGDQLRVIYENLSKDPNSLANLDQVNCHVQVYQLVDANCNQQCSDCSQAMGVQKGGVTSLASDMLQ
jgi:hypothetical protein